MSGGFDLYFSTQVWDPVGLTVDQIVRLRKMADEHGEIFIEGFDDRRMSGKLKSRAAERLKAWMLATVGL